MRRAGVLAALALIALAGLAPAGASAARRPIKGRVIAYMTGFNVMAWDAANGARKIGASGAGGSPSITADGHYVAWANKFDDCYKLRVTDLWARRDVPLPGIDETHGCNDSPRISPDGHYLVWSAPGPTPEQQSDIYLYDLAAGHMVVVPAVVNSASTEEYPSLALTPGGHYLLAFVTGRSAWQSVAVADLGADPAGAASLAALSATPGLVPATDGVTAQRESFIAADGSTIAFVTGPSLARKVSVYDMGTGLLESPAPLGSGDDTSDPAVSADGRLVIVGRQVGVDEHLAIYDRSNGSLATVAQLVTHPGEALPALAENATIYDTTPPTVTLVCKAKRTSVTCSVTSSEPAVVTLSARGGGASGRTTLHVAAGVKRTVHFARSGRGRVVVAARAVDAQGNARRVTAKA